MPAQNGIFFSSLQFWPRDKLYCSCPDTVEEAHTPGAELSELTSKSCNPEPHVLVDESRFLEVPIKSMEVTQVKRDSSN